jgi:hypothetical protein
MIKMTKIIRSEQQIAEKLHRMGMTEQDIEKMRQWLIGKKQPQPKKVHKLPTAPVQKRQPVKLTTNQDLELRKMYVYGVPKHDIERVMARERFGSYRSFKTRLKEYDSDNRLKRERLKHQRSNTALSHMPVKRYSTPHWKENHYQGYLFSSLYRLKGGSLQDKRNQVQYESWIASIRQHCTL